MPRYLVILEYRGTAFRGFQKQPGLPTVQGAIESALVAITGEELRVQGAGRTDTGTHALGQAAAFDMPHQVDEGRSIISMNALLPDGITITSMRRVPDAFDPRRDAVWREYRYFILNRFAPSALLDEFTYHFTGDLELQRMREVCAACLGEHDLSAFKAKSQDESSVRNIMVCEIAELFPGVLNLVVRANSFLYKMTRILAGAVLSVGSGRMTAEEFCGYLEKGGTSPCADPLPARGLFLWLVEYPPEAFVVE
jgi:tRNA pseudouridine38-40 synthase